MARKLIFLMNPVSGTASKADVRETIIRRTTAAGIDHEFMETNTAGHYPELEKRIRGEGLEEIIARARLPRFTEIPYRRIDRL